MLGYQAEKVLKKLPSGVAVVLNHEWEVTNVGHSLALGLAALKPGPVLVVYGDLVFGPETPHRFAGLSTSTALVDMASGRDDEVGLTVQDGQVTHFSYGLPLLWGQMILLAGRERALFERACGERHSERKFGFELLNRVLDLGGLFAGVAGGPIFEVDSIGDLNKVRAALLKSHYNLLECTREHEKDTRNSSADLSGSLHCAGCCVPGLHPGVRL